MNFIIPQFFFNNIFKIFKLSNIIDKEENIETFLTQLYDKLSRVGCEGKLLNQNINFEITPNIYFLNNIPNIILEVVFIFDIKKYDFIYMIKDLYLPECKTNYTYEEFVGDAENWINKDICLILFNIFNGYPNKTEIQSKQIYHTNHLVNLSQKDFTDFAFISFEKNKLLNYGCNNIQNNNIISYPFIVPCIKSEIYRLHMQLEHNNISNYYSYQNNNINKLKSELISINNLCQMFNLNLVNTQPFIEQNYFYIKNIDIIPLVNPLKKKSIFTYNCINQHLKLKLFNVIEKISFNNYDNYWVITSNINNLLWLFYIIHLYFDAIETNIILKQNNSYIINLQKHKKITLSLIQYDQQYYVHGIINFDININFTPYDNINDSSYSSLIQSSSLILLIQDFIIYLRNNQQNVNYVGFGLLLNFSIQIYNK